MSLNTIIRERDINSMTNKQSKKKTLKEYLSCFDVTESKTRKSYSLFGTHLFCIQKATGCIVGVPHRDEFAEYAKKCYAAHVGYSNGVFDGWVRFENENDAVPFLEYVVDVRSQE